MSFESFATSNAQEKAFFEAVNRKDEPPAKVEPEAQVDQEKMLFEAIETSAVVNSRALGMSAVISWVDSGEPTFESFDAMAQGIADVDEDGEISGDEEADYNDALFNMVQALLFMGVESETVAELIDESDKAASTAYVIAAEKLENMDDSEDELIADFSVQEQVMTEAKAKVIRDGKAVWVNKPLKKRRISSAQRAALKKARAKSNTAAAKAKRKKSMRKRKSTGL